MSSNEGARARPYSEGAARRQRSVGWTLTLILVAVYLVYLLSVVLNPAAMSTMVGGNFTLGLVGGAGVIVFALALAAWYVARADRADDASGRQA